MHYRRLVRANVLRRLPCVSTPHPGQRRSWRVIEIQQHRLYFMICLRQHHLLLRVRAQVPPWFPQALRRTQAGREHPEMYVQLRHRLLESVRQHRQGWRKVTLRSSQIFVGFGGFIHFFIVHSANYKSLGISPKMRKPVVKWPKLWRIYPQRNGRLTLVYKHLFALPIMPASTLGDTLNFRRI